jgi:CRISPR system Cascade subunit CasA
MHHNLLTDPLLPLLRPGWPARDVSLPGALAALSDDDRPVDGFDGLMAHQAMPWFCLLVQLAAIALDRATPDAPADALDADGLPRPWTEPDRWASALRALTPDHADDAPWCLVVPDPAKPAFLQPPTPKTDLARHKTRLATPDNIDLPVTAKNHDIKIARRSAASPAEWLYALTTLQTFGGFSGRGNQGVARMNGGFGSRAVATRLPAGQVAGAGVDGGGVDGGGVDGGGVDGGGVDWGVRFRRDLRVLLAQRGAGAAADGLIQHFVPVLEGSEALHGQALLWLIPWDEEVSLPMRTLDPHFIEVARHLRLVAGEDGRLAALFRPSETPRLAAKELKGALGDPWLPLAPGKEGAQALTVGPNGWTATRVAQILLGQDGYVSPPAQRALPGEAGTSAVFVFSVLVRGQGTTDGFHERRVGLPAAVVALLDGAPGAAEVIYRRLAKPMLELAGTARLKVLRPALSMLLQGPPAERTLTFDDPRTGPWLRRFDADVDAVFFDALAEEVAAAIGDRSPEDAVAALDGTELRLWPARLYAFARPIFQAATRSGLTLPSERRERAIARAELLFEAAAAKLNLRPSRQEAMTDEEISA